MINLKINKIMTDEELLCKKIPLGYRIWKKDFIKNLVYLLPLPFCWFARLFHQLYVLSWYFQPSKLEKLLLELSKQQINFYIRGIELGEAIIIEKILQDIKNHQKLLTKLSN